MSTVQPTVIVGLAMMAFACSDAADAFAIKWGALIHQDITREALNLTIELPNGEVKGFSMGVVLEIEEHNKRTDDYQGKEYTDRHFDNEDFPGGSRRLIQLREYVVSLLVHESFLQTEVPASIVEADRRVGKARQQMGEALHTLQDFYAHSNWVERTGLSLTQTNSNLGVKVLAPAYPADTCDVSDLANSALTSAFSNGNLLCLAAPNNKCDHGYENVLFCQGINKDSWEQAEDDAFFAARSQAVIATRNFLRDTLLEVFSNHYKLAGQLGEVSALQATQLAVCQFMGVPDLLDTCVTSHSITVQKLNKNTGQPTLEGLVESSGGNITPVIDCGLLCEGTSIAGTSVTLTAKDHAGWRFKRWASGGVCAGSTAPDCSFTVTGNQLAKPEFAFLDFVAGLSPQSSFLRTDPGDQTLEPLVIDLSELEIEPGEILELSAFGWFAWGPGLPEDARSTIMVFSSSNTLLSHNELHRVPGALPALVSGVVTTNTCSSPAPLATDIPEDFQVFSTRTVTVPAGAHFLFVGTFDCAYSDNSDVNGDLGVAIKYPLD